MYEDFCKRISSKSKNRMESSSSSEDEMVQEKSEEDEFIHHPFKVKDNSSIILNIRVCGHAMPYRNLFWKMIGFAYFGC